jgi:CRP/FNR family transcriptional regulator
MATYAVTVPKDQLEDPLAYLPCSRIVEYRKGQVIYGAEQTASNLCLIIEGTVKVLRMSNDGHQIVMDIYHTDDFVGESAFLAGQTPKEQAVAMENTKLMTWSVPALADIMARAPKLGIALLQLLAQRSLDFGNRLESFVVDNIARRLARSLIRFSERLGEENGDGSVLMMPFTHELLSQVVGTSREIVTHYMNQFRRQGYLQYSRKGISVHQNALRAWLRHPAA